VAPAALLLLGAAWESARQKSRTSTSASLLGSGDVGQAPGSGASGGLGAAFAALLGGALHPRYDVVMRYLELDALIERADLVITAEGSLDGQTPYGKIPAEVARRAKRRGLPVIALAGTIGKGVDANFAQGIDAFASIVKRPCTLEEAFANAGKWLARAAEDAVRMVTVGLTLARRGGGATARAA
jgi:glycerate kinase